MALHVTHLTNEELPEPGELRRVVSVHAGNRTYETVPVGQHSGFLVADPAGTNPVFWTDDEVSEVHDNWVRHRDGVPAYLLSRHGDPLPDPMPASLGPDRPRRNRRVRLGGAEQTTENTGAAVNVDADGEGDGES